MCRLSLYTSNINLTFLTAQYIQFTIALPLGQNLLSVIGGTLRPANSYSCCSTKCWICTCIGHFRHLVQDPFVRGQTACMYLKHIQLNSMTRQQRLHDTLQLLFDKVLAMCPHFRYPSHTCVGQFRHVVQDPFVRRQTACMHLKHIQLYSMTRQ